MATFRSPDRTLFVTLAVVLGMALGNTMAPSAQAEEVPDDCFDDLEKPVDVLFAFDLTASMSDQIESVKGNASDMLASLDENLTDPRFGVASHMDYPGFFSYDGYEAQYGNASAGDYPWALNQSLTNDTAAVEAAIDGLSLGDGQDSPESYSRVFHEAAEHGGWRSDVLKILVEWGDNPPHDDDFDGNNLGLDPGPDAEEGGGDDIDFQEVVDRMNETGVHALMVDAGFGSAEDYYRYAANQTDGAYAKLSDADKLADEVIELERQIKADDQTPPSIGIEAPEPGHLYVDGVDQGPGTAPFDDRATLAGDKVATATVSDNCDIEEASFEVPGTDFSETHTFPNTTTSPVNVTTDPFPASQVDAGNYTLTGTAVDWVDLNETDEVGLHVPDPNYVEGPCAADGTVKGYAGAPLSFPVDVTFVASDKDIQDLQLKGAPTGMTMDDDAPGNPVNATVEWPDPWADTHFAEIDAEGPYGHVSDCPLWITIEETPDGEARSVGLWTGTSTPESVDYRSHGVHIRDRGTEEHRAVGLAQPAAGVRAVGLDERGKVAVDDLNVTASGSTQAADVSLLGGLIEAEGLTHEAEVTWNLHAKEGGVISEERSLNRLKIAGEEVEVDDEDGPVQIELPGGGFVRLFERDVTRDVDGLSYRSNLIHVYTPRAHGGEEIIVGDLFLQAPNLDDRTPQSRAIDQQDDAGSGRDAGPAGPPAEISPGLYEGTFAVGDLVDRYAFPAEEGETVRVALHPASDTHADGGHARVDGTQPSVDDPVFGRDTTPHVVRLYDPDGDLRAEAETEDRPAIVEVDADLGGEWTLEVEREDDFQPLSWFRFHEERYSFYSFGLTKTLAPPSP